MSSCDALNVIASTQRRGAEMFATDLVADLRDRGLSTDLVALTAAEERDPLPVPVLGRGALTTATLRALRGAARPSAAVIAHGSRTLPACAIALAGTGVPFVYRSIGDPAVWSAAPARRARTALLLRRARLVTVLWQGAADVLVEQRGVAADRIRIIPNAVAAARCPVPDLQGRLAARQRFGLAEDEPVVAYVGSLTPEKQVDAAIAAVARLSGVRLLVAGSGPEGGMLEATAAREAAGRVQFLGAVSTVRDVLAAAEAVVLSSRTEGMPGVLIEAGLSTRPAAAFDVGAVSEVVVDGETGALAPAGDVGALAAAVERVLGESNRMGAAARERCLARFEIGVVGVQWAEVLAELAAARAVS